MISVTKLLFATEYFGDSLRYTDNAHKARNGVREGMGPVVVWNSTRTCNLKCRHCYMSSDAKKYQNELTTAEAKQFIDDLADFNVPVLLFSGGEPLIRPDFFELADYAAKKGVRPTLSTNGTLITPEVARKIKDIGVGYVGISLDGLREVNDKFRGKAGAFEAAMNGIKNCVAVDQRVGLRFTINHHNIQELENIFDFIEEENINRVCFYHLVYSGRGNQMMDEDVTAEESRRAMDIIIRRTRDFEERGLKKEILTVEQKMLTQRNFFHLLQVSMNFYFQPFKIGCKKKCKSRNRLIYTLCCGERGIRTPGTVARTPHFECGPIDHSGISPFSVAGEGPASRPPGSKTVVLGLQI